MTVHVYTGGASVVVIHADPPPLSLPVVDSFAAAPSVVTVGATILLAWTTTNADSVSIDNGVGVQAADGSIQITPAASGTYHLTAIGPGGTAQASVSITVNPVVVPTGKMPVLGTVRYHQQQNWQADWIDATVAKGRGLPWTLGADLPNGILARTKNGVTPTNAQAWHLWGNPTELYSEIPWFDPAGRSHPFNSEASDDIAQIVADLGIRPPSEGQRGLAMPVALTTTIPHPTFQTDGSVIPRAPLVIWLRHDALLQFGYASGEMENVGRIPGMTHTHDACLFGRFTFYICDLGTKNAAGIWIGGRIAHVDRTPGAVGSGGTPAEDPSKYVVTTLASAGYPTAVRVDEVGAVYFIDLDKAGQITKIPPNGTPFTLCTVPGVFAMDYALGKLYVICTDNQVRIIDASTGTVGPNLQTATYMPPNVPIATKGGDFFTVSVDAKGTCGPIGAFSCSRVHGKGNTNVWQFSPDGATLQYGDQIYQGSATWATVGRNVHERFGHYDWLGGKYHVDQAVRFVGGYANCPVGILVMDPTQPNGQPYPAQVVVDYTVIWRGMKVICQGGPIDDKQRPSLTCLMSREGWSMFAGCSNDEVAEMPYDAQEAWIHGGYAGSFRRDDIVGNDLYCVMMFHLVNSQRFIREGTAAYTALRAWWSGKGRPFPPSPAAVVTTFTSDPLERLEVRETGVGSYRIGRFTSGNSVDAHYSTANEQAGGVPNDAVIVVDQGMPSETTLPGNLTAGWHAFTVRAAGWATNAVTYKVP